MREPEESPLHFKDKARKCQKKTRFSAGIFLLNFL